MERRSPTPREALRKPIIPLAIAGAIATLVMTGDMGFSIYNAKNEAQNVVLPNASPEELANVRSSRKSELTNTTLRRNLVEGSTSVVLFASSVLLARFTLYPRK